jgi:O-antigen/teichoic acid export membrane protein
LAKANLLGTSLGLILTLPLYYYFKLDGIVPALILSSLITLLLAWFFAQKIGLPTPELTKKHIIDEGKDMLKFGFMLSVSGLITVGVSYLVRIYISNTGGVDDVGLYNAGFAIINTYVGLIFTAMGTDYYPRLTAVSNDNFKAKQLINQQAEIAILILAPILIVFIIGVHWAIILLYSHEFLKINGMIQWAAMGMFFKATCWSLGFIFLAKGDAKLFFWSELLANIYLLTTSFFCYNIWGLNGLGIAFLATYLVYLIQVFLISKKKYLFNFDKDFIKLFLIQFGIGILCFSTVIMLDGFWFYLLSICLTLLSIWYSFKELNKRIGIKNIIKNYARK